MNTANVGSADMKIAKILLGRVVVHCLALYNARADSIAGRLRVETR